MILVTKNLKMDKVIMNRKKSNKRRKQKASKKEKQMEALMKRIEEKERAIKQKEKDELKYKNQGETWMGPIQNGPVDRGGLHHQLRPALRGRDCVFRDRGVHDVPRARDLRPTGAGARLHRAADGRAGPVRRDRGLRRLAELCSTAGRWPRGPDRRNRHRGRRFQWGWARRGAR